MIVATPPGAHVLLLRHLPRAPVPPVGRRRSSSRTRLLTAVARVHDGAATDDNQAPDGDAAPGAGSQQRAAKEPAPASGTASSVRAVAPSSLMPKDFSRTLFQSECLEVLGLIDLEALRKRPRLTVGVTVKASVVLPVLVVLAVLYLSDMAKGVVDWTTHIHHDDVD